MDQLDNFGQSTTMEDFTMKDQSNDFANPQHDLNCVVIFTNHHIHSKYVVPKPLFKPNWKFLLFFHSKDVFIIHLKGYSIINNSTC
jgi:hypothetical protein